MDGHGPGISGKIMDSKQTNKSLLLLYFTLSSVIKNCMVLVPIYIYIYRERERKRERERGSE